MSWDYSTECAIYTLHNYASVAKKVNLFPLYPDHIIAHTRTAKSRNIAIKKTTFDKPHCTVSFHLSGSEWILGQCHLKRKSLPMTSKLVQNATDALDGSQGHHICIKYLGIILFCRNSREILHCWLCSWMDKPPTHPHAPEMNTEEGHLGDEFAHSAAEIPDKTTSAKWEMCPPKVLLHLKITPHWPHSTSSKKFHFSRRTFLPIQFDWFFPHFLLMKLFSWNHSL